MSNAVPESNPQSATSSRWKTIPIFISSTFRDMHAERDQLDRVVFPALEYRLRERRCRLEPIDLRVGVETSATQSERQREESILKVCLQEIDRSRPFLLVLLGDRYGWVPDKERVAAATEEAGFSTATSGRSVTSLEIEYGLLQKNPEQRRRSLIFLRDSLPYDRMGTDAPNYSDAHGTDPGAQERARHLGALKSKLAADPLFQPHIHRYTLAWDEATRRPREKGIDGLEDWGRKVEELIWRELDAETLAFARQSDPSWQEQERFALEEFTERLDRDFVGREALVEEAVQFALEPPTSEAGRAWCIAAQSGAGKSAFFSRIHRRLAGRDSLVVLAEAGGISPRAGRLYWTLRRWIGELAAVTGTAIELPDELRSEDLEKRFAEVLALAASGRRVVILADALNQFERTDRMLSLSWLPDPLPLNVRFLATAIPGPETDKLSRRTGARVTPLPLFTEAEIKAVAGQVYGRYHRSAPAEVIAQLHQKRGDDGRTAAGHALWLTLALELLNLLDADDFAEAETYAEGSPEVKLRRFILNRCAALPPKMEDLYDVFLRQVEKTSGTAEARSFAALIALSRNGWREEDLQKLLAPAAAVLFPDKPPVVWDALRFATWRRFFRAHIVVRGEHQQLDFTHVSLRQAVAGRLSGEWAPQPGQDPRAALHSAMADYLEAMPSGAPVRADEIMWQMLGTLNLPRFARYYASPESGSGRLAEYLIEESRAAEHPLLDFVCSATTHEDVPQLISAWHEKVQAAIGNKFNFSLHSALEERDGWALHAPLLEAAETLFTRLRQRNPQSADFARSLSASYNQLGDLHRGLGHGEQALEFHQKALAIREELRQRNPQSADFADDLSVSYERLGDLHLGLGHGEQALEFYQKALAIAEELRQRDPQSADFALHLSVSYDRLGDLHRGLGHGEQALEFFEKALAIGEVLRQRNPLSADFARSLSVSYQRLGNLHRGLGHGEQALEFCQKALAIAEELRQRNPLSADFARDLSHIYEQLGKLHRVLGHGEQALEFYQKALAIAEELRQRNPQSADFARVLSVSYIRLGDVHQGLGHGEQALEFYQKAIAIAEELRQRDPQSADFTRGLSVSYTKLGDLHRGLGYGEQALEFFAKGLAIVEELRQRNPQSADFARDLSLSYIRLGDVHQGLGHGEQALKFFEKRFAIAEELRQRNPQSADFARDLSVSYIELGDVHQGLGHGEQALEFYQKALAIAEELRQRDPQSADFARDVSVSYDKLGDLHRGLGHEEQALEFFEQALAIGEVLRQRNPQSAVFARDLSVSYSKLGGLHQRLGHGELALDFYQAAVAIAEELRERDPISAVFARDLSLSYIRLGDVHQGLGHGEQALKFFEKRFAIAEELRQRNPQSADFARDLSVSYIRLGDVHQGLGHGEQALEFYQKALAIAEELRQRDPQSADFARDVSVSYDKLGDLHRGLGHEEQALEFFEQALAIGEVLRQRNPQSAVFARDLSVSYSKLGGLHQRLGHGELALDFYQAAVAIAEELRERDPISAVFARDLAVSYWHMADLAEKLGSDGTIEWWRKLYEQLSSMKQRGLLLPTDKQALEEARRKVHGINLRKYVLVAVVGMFLLATGVFRVLCRVAVGWFHRRTTKDNKPN